VRAENCNPEKEIGVEAKRGELWEQGRIHWKLFEAKKPGNGSYLYFSCICGMVIGVIVL